MSAAELFVQDGQWVLTVRLLPGSPLEAAWEASLQPPHLCSAVRTSGVLLLLGVGTLVCCRLYARYAGGGTGTGGDPDPDGGWRRLLRTLLGTAWQEEADSVIEDGDDITPDDHIQVHYFGPSEYYGPPLAPSARLRAGPDRAGAGRIGPDSGRTEPDSGLQEGSSSCTELSASASADSLHYLGDHSNSYSAGDQYISDDEADCSSLEPEMGNKSTKNYEPVFYNRDAGVIFNRLQAEQLVSSAGSGTGSTGDSPQAAASGRTTSQVSSVPVSADPGQPRRRVIVPHVSPAGRPRAATSSDSAPSAAASPRARSLPPASPRSAARRHLLRRQLRAASQQGGSVDVSVAELCQMCRDGSFDSSASDLSLDLAWADGLGAGTEDLLERLESQLDVLKTDMSAMDSSLVTLHFPQAAAGARPVLGKSASEQRLRVEPAGAAAAPLPPPPADWPLDSPATDASLEWDSPVHGWSALPRAGRPAEGSVSGSSGRPALSRSQSASSSLRRSPSLELRPDGDMPSLEWDNSGIQAYPETWADDAEHGISRGLGDEMALELDLELELGSRSSRDSASLRSADDARDTREREASVESSGSTVQEHSSASRHGSLTLPVGGDQWPAADLLTESGYEGMDSSAVVARTPLSPVAETPAESGALSSDSAVSGSTDALNGNAGRRRGGSPGGGRANRDSAYWDDGLDTLAARALEAVGDAMDLLQYGRQEWRGTTPRAEAIRQGYEEMCTKHGLTRIQRVRGDNYCAVRAALYQLLAERLPLPNANRCRRLLESAGDWVTAWSFGSRLPYDATTAREGIQHCLSTLSELSEQLRGSDSPGRQLRQRWNSDPDLDLRCMEAVKLHMLAAAVQLEHDQNNLQTVPLFATLLFARDTSASPRHLMANHLNHVGDCGGLEQIEMCLLGHTLGVSLRVVRPSAHAQPDFVTFYPEPADGRPVLTLVAEDDRHYNVAS